MRANATRMWHERALRAERELTELREVKRLLVQSGTAWDHVAEEDEADGSWCCPLHEAMAENASLERELTELQAALHALWSFVRVSRYAMYFVVPSGVKARVLTALSRYDKVT